MMDRYLGMEAIVTGRLDDPYGGTWYVRLDADEGQYAWQARDLESLDDPPLPSRTGTMRTPCSATSSTASP